MLSGPGHSTPIVEVKALPMTQAIETLNFLHPDGEVFELCIIGPKTATNNHWEGRAAGKKPIVAGWFRNGQMAAKLAVQIGAEGVYTTLNPCQDALLARADHRLKASVDRTADNHIIRIKNLLIDIDPQRPSGISSTDQEHNEALELAQVIKADLAKITWPEPMAGDSGNGAHLIYPLDLPNTQESIDLVKAVLKALSLRYQEHLARLNMEIDQAVFNPARLTKLYGTMVGKGDNTRERPHRLSQIISLPEARQAVPIELLKELAATIQAPAKEPKSDSNGRLDLKAYLQRYGVEVVKEKTYRGGVLYCLAECIFDGSHKSNEAAIGQAADGTLYYQCFHNSCKGHTWSEARAIISGGDKLTEFIMGGSYPPAKPKNLLPPSPPIPKEKQAIIEITADKLLKKDFPEPRWAVPNLLPEGYGVLGGRPKIGKSFLAFEVALAISQGGYVLGSDQYRANQGAARYLALEDPQRRLQKRLRTLLQDEESQLPLDNLYLVTKHPRLDQGGIEALDKWLKEHPECRLVIIDTLAKVKPRKKRNDDPYADDMDFGGQLQDLANQHGICLLALHHTRKTKSDTDDFIDELAGSTGISGAPDFLIVLSRGRNNETGLLQITGREIEEMEAAVKFSPAQGSWTFLGSAKEYNLSQQRLTIINALKKSPEELTPKEIASLTGIPHGSVKHLISELFQVGLVRREGYGKYRIN